MANTTLTQTGQQVQADLDLLDNNNATQGQVLTADGSGGCAWANAGGGGGHTLTITDNTGGSSTLYLADGTSIGGPSTGTVNNVVAIYVPENYIVTIISGIFIRAVHIKDSSDEYTGLLLLTDAEITITTGGGASD